MGEGIIARKLNDQRLLPIAGDNHYVEKSGNTFGTEEYSGPYGRSMAFFVQIDPVALVMETELSMLSGDLEGNDSQVANTLSLTLNGAIKGMHLRKGYFTWATLASGNFNTTGPSHMDGSLSMPLYFFASNPNERDAENVVRFGVEPLAIKYTDTKLLTFRENSSNNIFSPEASYLGYSPSISFLFFNTYTGLGLHLSGAARLLTEGTLQFKEEVVVTEDGVETKTLKKRKSGFDMTEFSGMAEIFWMPFFNEGKGDVWTRGLSIYASAEYTASSIEWNNEARADRLGLRENSAYSKFLLGIEWGLFGNDGNGMLMVP